MRRPVPPSAAALALLATAAAPLFAQPPKPPADPFVVTHAGTIPVILSAPHGGRSVIPDVPPRAGGGVEKFTVVRDENTLELAEKLAAAIEKACGGKPYLVAARFERKQLDVNRPAAGAYESDGAKPHYDAYHAALAAHCAAVRKGWGRGLLLDLHGQGVEADTIFRGTQNLKTVTALKQRYGMPAVNGPASVLGVLEAKGYGVFPAAAAADPVKENPRFNGGHIVHTYGSDAGTGIDALQLEFGGKYRAKPKLDKTAADVAAAVAAFAKEYLPAEKLPGRKE